MTRGHIQAAQRFGTEGGRDELRAAAEGTRAFAFGTGRTPTVEIGVCRDGGDAETATASTSAAR